MPEQLTTAFKDCRVLDLRSGVVQDRRSILVANGKVLSVEEGTVSRMAVDHVFDVGGRFVLPGLIDAHAHIFCDPKSPKKPLDSYQSDSEAEALSQAAINLQTAIRAGVTTIRDCGSPLGRALTLASRIRSEHTPLPSIAACGRIITGSYGHALEIGVAADTEKQMLEAIDREVQSGASFIKLANYPTRYSQELLNRAVHQIHRKHHRISCCHTGDEESVRMAISAGFATIEHAAPYSSEMARSIEHSGAILTPTLYCARVTCEDIEASGVSQEDLQQHFLPWLQDLERHLPRAAEMGLRVAAGTDAGLPPIDFDDVHREIAHLVDIGFSALAALRAATIHAAAACGRSNHIGEVKAGHHADLLILDQNPFENVRATRSVAAVVKSGAPLTDLSRTSLCLT